MLAFILSISSINAFAATVTQDNLEVTLVTDKEKYAEDEQIKATLTVQNNNKVPVTNVDLETALPDGYKLADKSENKKTVDSIAAGESVSLNVVLEKDSTPEEDTVPEKTTTPEEDTIPVKRSTPSEPSTDSKSSTNPVSGGNSSNSGNSGTTTGGTTTNGSAVQTGQGFLVVGIVLLVLLSAGILFVFVYRRKKDSLKRFLSIILCISFFGVTAFSLRINSNAEELSKLQITINDSVVVDGKDITIHSKIVYDSIIPPIHNITFENFKADVFDIYINSEEQTTFTVNVITDQDSKIDVGVYDENNTFICTMNDNGVDGDEVAGDGLYSGIANLFSEEVKLLKYHAEYNGVKSESFEICYYRDLTQEEFASFTKLMNKISSMTYEEAYAFIQNSSEIKSFSVNENEKIISFMSTYGIGGIWDNYIQSKSDESILKGRGEFALPDSEQIDHDVDGSERLLYNSADSIIGAADITPAHSKHDVVALRPFRNTEFQYDDFEYASSSISSALDGQATVIDDGNVTVEVMKNLSNYGTVLIDSHGTLKDGTTPYMLIGEELNETRFLWDPVYYLLHVGYSADYLSGRIYCTGYHNRLAIGGKFIDRYYSNGSLSDSIWYLGTCYSMYDNTISNALTGKGAKTVFGFSQPVTTYYCNDCLFEIFVNSLVLSADTTRNAYNEARRIYGNVDLYDTSLPRCELKIAGDDSYKLVNRIQITEKGTLSGKICKASDRSTPIFGAVINVYKDGELYQSKRSDPNGNYSTRLPEGRYYIEIKAIGYIDFHSYATVTKDENTYMETFLMVEGDEGDKGTASGKVINSLTNVGTEGVNLSIRKDWNNTNNDAETIGSTTTSSGGMYSIELPLGNYTVVASKDGYLTSTFNIIVQSGITGNQNGTITPIISGDEYLITLTWGENPCDLDSHVEGTLSSGSSFHVYYPSSNMNQYDGDIKVCSLDYDDTTSYGPEHITLKPTTNDPYYYYIHRYEGSGTVASSGAKITVHKGNQLIATYNVPTNLGSDDYWNVFAIKNGQIINKNTITSSADTSYAR